MSYISAADGFLIFACSVNVFRTIVYSLNLKHTCRAKVAEKFWADENIQEVAFAHGSVIRLFMAFRAAICYWAYQYMQEGEAKNALCYLLFVFDVYILTDLIFKQVIFLNSRKVMRHADARYPIYIQSSLVIAGIVSYFR